MFICSRLKCVLANDSAFTLPAWHLLDPCKHKGTADKCVCHYKVVYFPCFLHTINYRLGGKNENVSKKIYCMKKRNIHLFNIPSSTGTFWHSDKSYWGVWSCTTVRKGQRQRCITISPPLQWQALPTSYLLTYCSDGESSASRNARTGYQFNVVVVRF